MELPTGQSNPQPELKKIPVEKLRGLNDWRQSQTAAGFFAARHSFVSLHDGNFTAGDHWASALGPMLPKDPRSTWHGTGTPSPEPLSLLDEIDARQNEILSQLDSLNARIEQLLQEAMQSRQPWQKSR